MQHAQQAFQIPFFITAILLYNECETTANRKNHSIKLSQNHRGIDKIEMS